jgi:phosphoglycerate dehydrogenase-like enzyme
MSVPFRVGVTRDFLRPDGTLGYGDVGLGLLDGVPGLTWEFLSDDGRELRPDQVRDFDALLVLAPRVTAATLEGSNRLSVIARFGVGYDSVDVDACTSRGVLLTITPDGVRRPVALAVLTFLLALSHKLLVKDRLTRAGRWAEKVDFMGTDVTGRTLGVVGFGNVGREVFELAKPLGMRHLAHDPYAGPADAALAGAELVGLEELLGAADFVCLCCALTPQTHHLIDGPRLALMKRSAYLINVARGPVVDQKALTEALQQRRIAGAGLDVFEQEPIDPADPILTLDNVIVAPHALCWTDGCFRAIGASACRSILAVAAGRPPDNVVNRAALADAQVLAKLSRYSRGG